MTDKQIIFIKNEFQKYKGVPATYINNANDFLNIMKDKIKSNHYFFVVPIVLAL